MVSKQETVCVWLLCLMSFNCDVYGIVSNVLTTPSVGQPDDQPNWNLLANHARNSPQRTSNTKLNVFSKILLANIKARTRIGRTNDGVFLFQGDIKIHQSEVNIITAPGNTGRKKRALMRDRTRLWQSPIYYDLSPKLNNNARKAIESAIKEWKNVLSCVQWVNKNVSSRQPSSYLHFFPGDGCFSNVGRTGERKQEISIGDGCEDHGTVVHEIAHALGFWHEQSRQDRDSYVKIIWQNILPAMRYNFEKYSRSEINNHGVKYDYASVMHYGAYDFAKQAGLKTIQTLRKGVNIGDSSKLSQMDVKQAKLLYGCKKAPSPSTQAPLPTPSTPPSPTFGSGSGALG